MTCSTKLYVIRTQRSFILISRSALRLRSFSTWHRLAWYTFFSITQQPLLGQGSSLSRPHEHTLRHTTLGRTPLDEWSARRRDLYLTTHNIHNRQTLMPPAGFEPATPSERVAADPRLRPGCHWDRPSLKYRVLNFRSNWRFSSLGQRKSFLLLKMEQFSRSKIPTYSSSMLFSYKGGCSDASIQSSENSMAFMYMLSWNNYHYSSQNK